MKLLIALIVLLGVSVAQANTVPCDFSDATAVNIFNIPGSEITDVYDQDYINAPSEWELGTGWEVDATNLNRFYRDFEPVFWAAFTRNDGRQITGFIEVRQLDGVVWVFMQDSRGQRPPEELSEADSLVYQYAWHGCAAYVLSPDSDVMAWFTSAFDL